MAKKNEVDLDKLTICYHQPCTTRDFMNYLKYIEHAAENLQFWLWYRDYSKRFSDLPPNEQCLAPEWTVEQAEAETPKIPQKVSPETVAALAGTDFAIRKPRRGNPFETPPATPVDPMKKTSPSVITGEVEVNDEDFIHAKAAGAFEKADLKWQPCESAASAGFDKGIVSEVDI